MAKKKPRPGGRRPHFRPTPPPGGLPDPRVMEGVIQQLNAQIQGLAEMK